MSAAGDLQRRGADAAPAESSGEEKEADGDDAAAATAPRTVATTSSSTLFVLGLPYDCSNEQLEEFFSEVGPVKGCFAVVDRSAPPGPAGAVANKGFGFVHYALPEDAKRALVQLKKKEFLGKRPPRKLALSLLRPEDQSVKEAAKAALITPKKRKANELETEATERARERPAPHQKPKDSRGAESVLRVTGLPAGVTNKQIYKRVRKSGSVTKLIRPAPAYADGSGEADDGVAHVVYGAFDDVKKAQKHLDQRVFKGAKLAAVPLAEAKRELRKARLIVRNVPWKMDEAALRKVFSKHGGVVSVALPRKTPDGPLRGFAFVQMNTVENAEAAVKALNATMHYGRPIAVDWALAKGKFDEAEKAEDKTQPPEEAGACHPNEAPSEWSPDGGASPADEPACESVTSGFHPSSGCVTVVSDNEERRMGGLSSEDSEAGESEEGEEEEDDKNEVEIVESEEKVCPRKSNRLPTAKDGSTVFVRNLSFDSTEEDLAEKFSEFGPVLYTKIVTYPATGRSRGVAFVCFREASAARECIQAYEVLVGEGDLAGGKKNAAHRKSDKKNAPARTTDKKNHPPRKSVLLPEFAEEDRGPFFLDGRLLNVTLAVSKERAKQLEKLSAKKR